MVSNLQLPRQSERPMNCPKCSKPFEHLMQNCPSCGAELYLAPSRGWRIVLAFRSGFLTFGSIFIGMVASGTVRYLWGPPRSPGLFPVYLVGLVLLFAASALLRRPGRRAIVGMALSVVLAFAAVYCLLDAQHFSLSEEVFSNWPWGIPQW